MTGINTALPLVQGVYNRLSFLLTDYMLNVNIWTQQIFGEAAYAYIKDDLASIQRPSIFIYPRDTKKNSWAWNVTGVIRMEMHFGLQFQRTELPSIVTQIIGDIELINWNGGFINYLQNSEEEDGIPRMPGLIWFGKYQTSDYKHIWDKECVAYMDFDFNVDMQLYQNTLQQYGFDTTSPDEVIYPPAQALYETLIILNKEQEPVFEVH